MLEKLNDTLSILINEKRYPSKSGKNPFINFTRLSYQLTTWLSEKELIENRRILKWQSTFNYLTDKEKLHLQKIEKKIVILLNKWLVYKEIKEVLYDNSKENGE